MAEINSILESSELDISSVDQLDASSKWANFIGIVYLVASIMILMSLTFLVFNLDSLMQGLNSIYGMSGTAMEIISGYGKWLLVLLMLLFFGVMVYTAISLIRFRSNTKAFMLTSEENHLTSAFDYLGRYLMISAILSLVSIVISLIASVFIFLN